MIVIATLQVKDFDALTRFENTVAPLLAACGARILHAIEVQRHADGSGEEIHVLDFPSAASLDDYKRQTRTNEMLALRDAAMSGIELKIGQATKNYGCL